MSDLTKTQGQLMDWSTLDDTGGVPFLETSELGSVEDLDSALGAVLHIDMAHQDTNAAGNLAHCKIWIKSGSTDEDWHEFISLTATDGTANSQQLDANSGSGQANPDRIQVASTTNFETPGDKYFLKDVGDLTNSCIVVNKDYVNDDYVVHMDDLVGAYDSSDFLYDVIDQWSILLPSTIQAAKVTFHNEDSDATYACRVRYTIITDIE